MMRGKKKTTMAEKDEVDQLLEAAQDEVMLSLSVDSHISSVSSDYIDPDLRRRFNALRSRPSAANPPKNRQPPQQRPEEGEKGTPRRSEDVGESQDDLMARFAALKASLPASSSVSEIPRDGEEEEEEEEDEVEKVIKWAMDAARLDPSPDSDDEDHLNHSSDDDDDDDKDGSKKDGKR